MDQYSDPTSQVIMDTDTNPSFPFVSDPDPVTDPFRIRSHLVKLDLHSFTKKSCLTL